MHEYLAAFEAVGQTEGRCFWAGRRISAGPKIRPQLGTRQRPAARQRRRVRGNSDGDLAGCGRELAGVGVDGLDDDFVAEALEALDVVAGLAAGVHALLVVVRAEVDVAGFGVG